MTRTGGPVPRSVVTILGEESGASAVEYTAIIALVTAISISAFASLGTKVSKPIKGAVIALDEQQNPGDLVNRPQRVATRQLPSQTEEAESVAAATATREYYYFTSLGLCTVACLVLLIRRRVKTKNEIEAAAEEIQEESELFNKKRLFEKRQQILNILSSDIHSVFDSSLTVRKVMSKRVTVVHPKTPVEELSHEMEKRNLRHLLVCDDGLLIGIISDRDLLRRTGKVAKDIMTPNPSTISPDSAIVPAVTQLVKLRINCLPVAENGQLHGVLTTTDLMMTLQCTFQLLGRVAKEVKKVKEADELSPAPQVAPENPPLNPAPAPVPAVPLKNETETLPAGVNA